MRVGLAYGKTGLEVDLPDEASVTFVEPRYLAGLPDQAGAVLKALRQPIDSPALRELVKPSAVERGKRSGSCPRDGPCSGPP